MPRVGLPATATAMRQRAGSWPVARLTACAATAGDTSRNGTHWQRLTMVGSITSAEVPSKMNITPSGGSSSVLSSALAVLARSCSARSMM